jgi:hypothetical protein
MLVEVELIVSARAVSLCSSFERGSLMTIAMERSGFDEGDFCNILDIYFTHIGA